MNQLNADATAVLPAVAALPESPAAEAGSSLQRELDKWRERVARLLAALKERSEEVERLQRELTVVRAAGPAPGVPPGVLPVAQNLPGARAREVVIDELERELAGLRDAHAGLQGDLHARSLAISGLKRDLQGWKDKWHDLARRLDGASSTGAADGGRIAELTAQNGQLNQELAVLRRVLAELTEERDSLQARNANLFETTGFANRQMEVLADDLAELRGQLKALRGKHEAAVVELEALREERADLLLAARDARSETETLESLLQSLQAAAMALGADVSAADRATAVALARLESEREDLVDELSRSAARAAGLESALAAADQARVCAEQARADAEQVRLRLETACQDAAAAGAAADQARAGAEAARDRAEAETRGARETQDRLQQQTDQQFARQQQLERQLDERSALVRGLEEELIGRDQRLERLETEWGELEAGLARATRNAREQTDYAQQLDGRLERQKELLLSLEQELLVAQESQAAAARRHEVEIAARDSEMRALHLQIVGLQSLLQEQSNAGSAADRVGRGEAAGDGASGEAGAGSDVAGDGGATPDPVRAERDSRTLRVLNQQLRDERARNETLLGRIRDLETRALLGGEAPAGDDLTRIRGLGPRIAQHLRELGVSSYEQIAELNPEDLDDPSHALAALRSRILRDRWIEQAAGFRNH